MRNTLQMIEWAREEGADAAMDVMPTNLAHTNLTAILTSWSFALSKDNLFELLNNPAGRERQKVSPLPKVGKTMVASDCVIEYPR